MKKKELAEKVSLATGYKESEVEEILESVFDEIANSLKKGEEVKIFGFGKFISRSYGERKCYNPITGELIKLSPSVQPAFIAGPKLREKINN